ncbi:unnamed protein product, partial [Closterium sp. NIES-54]
MHVRLGKGCRARVAGTGRRGAGVLWVTGLWGNGLWGDGAYGAYGGCGVMGR